MKYRIKVIEHDGEKLFIPQQKWSWFVGWHGFGFDIAPIGHYDTYYPTLEQAQEIIDADKKIEDYSKNKKTTYIPQ